VRVLGLLLIPVFLVSVWCFYIPHMHISDALQLTIIITSSTHTILETLRTYPVEPSWLVEHRLTSCRITRVSCPSFFDVTACSEIT